MLAPQHIADNIARVRARLGELSSNHVALIAVTKTWPREAMELASNAGVDGLGENYAKELVGKVAPGRQDLAPIHFIGGLQSNKIKSLVPHVDVWQSIDRSSLVREVGRRHREWIEGGGTSGPPRVLLQVNTTGETNKAGCAPSELESVRAVAEAERCEVLGLMTVGPTDGDPHVTERAFRTLRALVDRHDLAVCSMGMTGDFELAVTLGSTMVRIGSAIFGARQ